MPLMGTVSTSSLIGVAMSCCGNVLISLALTLQKLAHRRIQEGIANHDESDQESQYDSDDSRSSSDHEVPVTPERNGAAANSNAEAGGTSIDVPVVVVPAGVEGILIDGKNAIRDEGRKGESRVNANADNDSSTSTESGAKPTKSRIPGRIALPGKFTTTTSIRIDLPASGSTNDDQHSPGQNGTSQHEKRAVEEGAYLKSRLWWCGLGLITIGEGGNFLSYGFAPASVVAPLGTIALIANCLFAPLILRERFHPRELIGMGLAILGAVTVVWSSSNTSPRLVNAIHQLPFLIYTSLNILALIALILLSESSWGERLIGIDVGTCALFGGYTVLSTKALSSLLATMFLSAFGYWITWLLLAVLVGTSVMQVKYLNRALMRFESKEVIPTQFVFFSLAAIIGSAVLYQEFRDVTFSQFVNFAFGIATTFLGVHLLTSYQTATDGDPSLTSEETSSPTTSSAHANLTDRTPLLSVPSFAPVSGSRRSSGIYGNIHLSSPPSTAALPPQVRLIRKMSSNGDFSPTSTLGLNTQAGFLLLATTPPPAGMVRGRSTSRSLQGQGPGPGTTPPTAGIKRGRSESRSSRIDEERAAGGYGTR